jgi:hypothetical protein
MAGLRSRTMTYTSIGRIAASTLVLVGACTVVFGIPRVPLKPVAVPTVAAPAPSLGQEGSVALKTAPIPADRSPSSGRGDGIAPAFDIAVIGRTGDAVIAGTAAPGAMVELLRNGELQDQAVADQFGQFVMVPPQLPAGDYEMTLRSKQPDGTQATSPKGVAISVRPTVKDEPHTALMTPDGASAILSKPVAPTPTCHPSRAGKR